MKELFAKRLKSARKMSGLSMEKLGELIGVSKEAISKYEHAKAMPNSTNLIIIANALGVNPDFFFTPQEVELHKLEYRKKSAVNVTKSKMIEEKVLTQVERYLDLERIIGVEHDFINPLSDFNINTSEDVEVAASIVRSKWGNERGSIISVIEFLEKNTVKVVEIVGVEGFDGMAAYANDHIPVIAVCKTETVERKRFTLLHELGHLLLNLPNDLTKKEVESYCNRFAGALLLPGVELTEKMGPHRSALYMNEIFEIQRDWGLSGQAIMYRLKDLKIISDNYLSKFYRRMNNRYDSSFKKSVDKERYPGDEYSGRFGAMLLRGLAEGLISFSKASSLSGESIDELKNKQQYIL